MYVEISTDGACIGNPGPGGWAALLRYAGQELEVVGGEADTTNNRMELMAAIEGLRALKRGCRVRLTTDSQYVLRGYTEWLEGWQRRKWAGVKNADLWQSLVEAAGPHQIEWIWVRGHSGHSDNERVDRLARAEAEKIA